MAEVIDALMVKTPPREPYSFAADKAIPSGRLPIEQRTDVTVNELEKISLPSPAELYNGKVVLEHKWPPRDIIQGNIHAALKAYVRRNRIGYVTKETGFQLWPDRPNELRFPDVAFIKRERLPEKLERFLQIAPDLAVEIVGPDDTVGHTFDKVNAYLKQGSQVVWLIVPFTRLRHVLVCTATGKDSTNDILTASKLLPGFELPVSKIFEGIPLPD
ncbi:MAG: Uma2 family endonuclease [Nitrososphaera sp.]